MGDLTSNLSTYEYLAKREYNLYKAGKIPLFNLLDIRLYLADQKFINRYGTTIINNWHDGGSLDSCGFRASDYKGAGAFYSIHKTGKASDKHPQKVTVDEVFADIEKHPEIFIAMGFTVFEKHEITPSWIHGAVPVTGASSLVLVGL